MNRDAPSEDEGELGPSDEEAALLKALRLRLQLQHTADAFKVDLDPKDPVGVGGLYEVKHCPHGSIH